MAQCLIFPAVVTVCYHLPSVSDGLSDPTTYPTIYVLRQTMSDGWLTALLAVIIALLICSNITYLAAVTRDAFAFARDNGFPASFWIAKVELAIHIHANRYDKDRLTLIRSTAPARFHTTPFS